MPFFDQPATVITQTVEDLIKHGNIEGLFGLLDTASSLFSILDVLKTNGYDPAKNTITITLPHTANTTLNDLAARLHGLRLARARGPRETGRTENPHIDNPQAPMPSADCPSPSPPRSMLTPGNAHTLGAASHGAAPRKAPR